MGKKPATNFTLKKTRKAFLIEYFCGFFLLFLVFLLHQKQLARPQVIYFVTGLALVSLASGEISRLMHRYTFTDSKLVIIDGIIRQHKKHIYFFSLGFIPDINVRQDRIQRFLGYGTVYIKSGNESFEVKDVNHPHAVMEEMEKLIEKNKRHESERRK